jgi:hypothetical protein
MPEPIEYTAVRALQTALLAISVAGGYHYTVEAGAVKMDPNTDVESLIPPDGPRPFVILEVQPERRTHEPASQLVVDRAFTVYWVYRLSAADASVDEAWMRAFFRGCADVEEAIEAAQTAIGFETLVERCAADQSFGSEVWAVIDVSMQIRRTLGQPNA